MKLITIFSICSLFIPWVNGQTIYYGRVTDAGLHQPVEDVHIILQSNSDSTVTNNNGDFILSSKLPEDNVPQIEGEYYIQDNSLYWVFNTVVNIQVISLNGKIIFQNTNLPNYGSVVLPLNIPGFYFLIISSSKGTIKSSVISTGNVTVLAGKSDKGLPSYTDYHDSLIFTKTGYYRRKIKVPHSDTLININLLKKLYEDIDYMNELISYPAFDMLESHPLNSNLSEVQSVKIIYNMNEDEMYYVNSKKYDSHYDFARDILHYDEGPVAFTYIQYTQNKNRYLFPASLNYFKSSGIYVLEFFTGDGATCVQIQTVFDKIISTSYLKDELVFHCNHEKWNECISFPSVNSDVLYSGQNYQALNLEENYGYLTRVDIDEVDNTYMGRHDIVLLNGIPNDISVVAGIITTEFQTPLSHINVLSHNRGTPNMALRDGWGNPLIDSLIDNLVYLKVASDSFILRKASYEEASVFWNQHEPQDTIILEKNTGYHELVNLDEADKSWINIIGGKAANFTELLNTQNSTGTKIPVPEGYFAIPFYYYQQHINQLGLQTYINHMLEDSLFLMNTEYRTEVLEKLRDSISNSPLTSNLLNMVIERLEDYDEFSRFRFRSSTNAEDLEFFSGAGLYSSYTGNLNAGIDDVEEAIKDVWASLWNFRAFEEREYYKIDHKSTAMGILVHRSFPDEDANGVIITKNLYNANSAFTINVQYGEYSIVYPEPGIIHDQILLYTFALQGQHPFTIDYLLHSNIPELNGEHVLSNSELYTLGELCLDIKRHFYYNVPHSCNCEFIDFALDIEFKIDSTTEPRKIYIKQVRPYK